MKTRKPSQCPVERVRTLSDRPLSLLTYRVVVVRALPETQARREPMGHRVGLRNGKEKETFMEYENMDSMDITEENEVSQNDSVLDESGNTGEPPVTGDSESNPDSVESSADSETVTEPETGEETTGENTGEDTGIDNSEQIEELWNAINLQYETSMQNTTSITEDLNLILSEIQMERTLAQTRYEEETRLAEEYKEYYQHFYGVSVALGFMLALILGYLISHGFWSRMKVG